MNWNKYVMPAFAVLVLIQLYVPIKMVFDRENLLKQGTEYKFKTAPIDPNDPFRGKYVALNFEGTTIDVPAGSVFEYNEDVYATLMTDGEGYAIINSVSKEIPADIPDYLKVKVSYFGDNKLTIQYPFDRFYMEESKAPGAEEVYQASLIDSNQVTYALVSVKDGMAVLKDVVIDGVPIKEVVKNKK